jgi:hypothetical protein
MCPVSSEAISSDVALLLECAQPGWQCKCLTSAYVEIPDYIQILGFPRADCPFPRLGVPVPITRSVLQRSGQAMPRQWLISAIVVSQICQSLNSITPRLSPSQDE